MDIANSKVERLKTITRPSFEMAFALHRNDLTALALVFF